MDIATDETQCIEHVIDIVSQFLGRGEIVGVQQTLRFFFRTNLRVSSDECLNRSVPDTNFLLLCINWLSERQNLLAIPPKETPIYTLDLKPGQLDQIVLIVVAGIPMLAAVFGVLVWTARRR